MIKITDKAVSALQKKNGESKGSFMIRVSVSGYGWGGPNFKVVLDEQKQAGDIVTDVNNGVKVVYRSELEGYMKNVTIDYSKFLMLESFFVSGGSRC